MLRQQQQRLLLLRHASKCKYGTVENPSVCPATKHCKDMKQLWQHITRCKDQACQRAHCVSRYEGMFSFFFFFITLYFVCGRELKKLRKKKNKNKKKYSDPQNISLSFFFFNSRYVLSHYNRCKEEACAVCKPVRDAISTHKQRGQQGSRGGTMANLTREVSVNRFVLCIFLHVLTYLRKI